MAYTLYEANALADLKEFFEENFAAVISGIASEQGDGISTPDFKRIETGEMDVFALNVYPALLLYPEEVRYETLTTMSDSLELRVVAVIVLKGAASENLVTKALRYVAATREIIDADRTGGSNFDRVAVSEVRFYPRPPGAEDFIVIEAVLTASKEISRA